ncbi:DUF2911 domain-containing protein [Tunicatimonas pelagia]|uniref:DUF2911 domain-containing protein n=1 Tax=Tunicatimonas pelagia TaxID=931531 RepID=UPI002666DA6A|nr:DUF2911 domain-containing protein [Tunicatimonas pelagia]WKN45116.1 DUF2911 domain-containing protein [Tunicatimonas pelagia]
MLKELFSLILSILLCLMNAQAQVVAPAMSPTATVHQQIGFTDLEVIYSRPSARNRTIFGEEGVVRFAELWRTGANATTKLTVSEDITLTDVLVSKGEYAVLSRIEPQQWTLLLYPYASRNWQSYTDATPAVTVTAPLVELPYFTETFTIGVEDIQLDKASLVLRWAKTETRFSVQTEVHQRMMATIDRAMAGPSRNDYFQAALYLHEAQTDLERALTYIQEVTEHDDAQFFQVYREALILADLNQNAEAIEAAKRSKRLSKVAGNTDLVRLNEQLIQRLNKN